jgi:acyl-ACP thioesterase
MATSRLRPRDHGNAGPGQVIGTAAPHLKGTQDVAVEFVEPPEKGRRYRMSRPVYLGDVDGHDEMHLEALGRFLQDIATDDAYDSGLRELGGVWVVRRYDMRLTSWPAFREVLDLVTFCGGTGPCWAERRTSVTAGDTPVAEAVALWVFADQAGGRPLALGDQFYEIYGVAAGGRRVSSRLVHAPPGPDVARRPWALRARDLDFLDHVNNARALEAVEDEVARRHRDHRITSVSLEFRGALGRETDVELLSDERPRRPDGGAELSMWLVSGGTVRMSANVTSTPRTSSRTDA